MIPTVEFRFSWIYNEFAKAAWKKQHPRQSFPSDKEIERHAARVRREWKKVGGKILIEIAQTSGLRWREPKIICYVVGRHVPFSDPLTLPVYSNLPTNFFIDVLTHELIHQIFRQNWDHIKPAIRLIHKKYHHERFNVRIHIHLYAIHTRIYLKIFNQKRLERNIQHVNDYPDYRRAWQIVQSRGHESLIHEFKSLLN